MQFLLNMNCLLDSSAKWIDQNRLTDEYFQSWRVYVLTMRLVLPDKKGAKEMEFILYFPSLHSLQIFWSAGNELVPYLPFSISRS